MVDKVDYRSIGADRSPSGISQAEVQRDVHAALEMTDGHGYRPIGFDVGSVEVGSLQQ